MVIKPWGNYVDFVRESDLVIKKLTISPGECISLQYHLHRKEKWFIRNGTFILEINKHLTHGKAPYNIDIDIGVTHRVMNVGQDDLIIYEIQTGECREDDIVRLEDKYGREVL